jgi:hypothetical protein
MPNLGIPDRRVDDTLRHHRMALPTIEAMASSGIPIPDGVITVDLYRQQRHVWTWLRVILQVGDELRLQRDIVILDPSKSRALYREGPYNGITVGRAIERIEVEVRSIGLAEFLFKRQVQESRIGPLSQSSGKLGFWTMAIESARYYRRRLSRPHTPRTPPPTE